VLQRGGLDDDPTARPVATRVRVGQLR